MSMRIVISVKSWFCLLIYVVLPAALAYTAVAQLGRETGSRATIIFTPEPAQVHCRQPDFVLQSFCSSLTTRMYSDILIVDASIFSFLIVTPLDFVAPSTRSL